MPFVDPFPIYRFTYSSFFTNSAVSTKSSQENSISLDLRDGHRPVVFFALDVPILCAQPRTLAALFFRDGISNVDAHKLQYYAKLLCRHMHLFVACSMIFITGTFELCHQSLSKSHGLCARPGVLPQEPPDNMYNVLSKIL